jgi:Flp pilus assembly protein TadD
LILALALPAPALAGDLTAYVRARAADADGAVDVAAAGYADALASAPDSEVVAIRAYREALAAGDLPLARRAASVLLRAKVAPPDTAILGFADALHAKDLPAAAAAAEAIAAGPLDFMAPVLRAWLAFDAGQDPLPLLDPPVTDKTGGGTLANRFAAEHRALLQIATGQVDAGIAGLRVSVGADQGSLDLRLNAALLLAGKGRKDVAQALLQGPDPMLADVRARIGRGVKPSAAFGAARLFTRLAADLAHEETQPLSILLARAALLLDSQDDNARILLADSLSRDGSHAQALAVLGQIGPRSLFARPANANRVTILTRAGRPADALAHARALYETRGAGPEDAERYADLLVSDGAYTEAAAIYAGVMADGGDNGWVMHLQRGGALEQAGRWDEARPLLQRAVELAPEQPVALNYLGYALVERGEDMAKAQSLLERASRLRPDDPAITDSLAWAYFKNGDPARAVPLLEKAAAAQPGDTTINEHLGDAYWRVGRRYEARYAWKAASVYADAGDEAARIAAKLADGLKTAAN